MTTQNSKVRLATTWFGGCAGCHMSFLDLDERLIDVLGLVDIVFGPVVDIKKFPDNVDVTLIEGAVANSDHVKEAREIRRKSKIVISFGDCAVTGNVPAMRNALKIDDVLTAVYAEGPGKSPPSGELLDIMPVLLPKVLPVHQVIPVDLYLPGCPPNPDRIFAAVAALLKGEPVTLPEEMRSFG
ncbi:MAG TPA: NADP oxidoreductase [Syntrophobacteraceae bacterium]|nr:NADP oxidoreductase [Syntrophobacteraceae bacterium]